jgi:hypothetical protein
VIALSREFECYIHRVRPISVAVMLDQAATGI